MNVATWSMRNPIPSIMLFILFTVAGVWGFQQLSTQDLPDLDLPVVTISLTHIGAAPAQLESDVARKVENSLATLHGVRHIHTSITDGQVSIEVEFTLETAVSSALSETKNAVDSIRAQLPMTLEQPVISTRRSIGGAVMTYAVSSTRLNEEALSWFVDDKLEKVILAIPGVGRFERVGGVEREVIITVDPVRMDGLGVTAADISRALNRVQQQGVGGRGQLGGAEQSVRVIGSVLQADQLAALRITLPDGRNFRLDDIATIRDDTAEKTHTALLGGNPVVGFSIYRKKGFDEGKIAEEVRDALARVTQQDHSLHMTFISGTVEHTLEQYHGSMMMLYEGAILAIIVVWLFLRNWRATIISATALPLSILPAFACMDWLGYSLNTVTLLALAVVVGILVDDAIVEVENIERHRQMGKPIRQAAEDAVNEIALAVTATTLCLVAVFLPTALMSGIPGLMFKQFGWTAVIAVLASLLVARLLTPMMAVYMLKPGTLQHHPDGVLMRKYLIAARWSLHHRRLTLLGAILFFAASLMLIPFIPTGFVPAADTGYTVVNVELPPGSSLHNTLAVTEAARLAIQNIPGIKTVFTTIGEAQQIGTDAMQAGDVRIGAMTLVLTPRSERTSQLNIENQVRKKLEQIPGARFSLTGSGLGEKLQLILASDNAEALKSTAQEVERELRSLGKLPNITSTASLERPEIIVRPDNYRAAELGVTTAAIADTLRIATQGDMDADVARLNFDSRQVYIRVRVSDRKREELDTLLNLRIPGRNGLVLLSSVASVTIESGPSQIDRYDRRRFVTINADLGGMPLSDALEAAHQLPIVKQLPSNVEMMPAGDAEIATEFMHGFGMAIIIGILCVFSVLVLLFKNFFQPITILSAIPLSVGGAFIALLAVRSELNVPSMIGLVMLMGIVTKNSILLVEYALQGMLERGMSATDAVLDACHKRARPIVMTTLAMVAGMLPIALGLGGDASFRLPMAMAVIGGLITSTMLSLIVVPVVFVYITRFSQFCRIKM